MKNKSHMHNLMMKYHKDINIGDKYFIQTIIVCESSEFSDGLSAGFVVGCVN